MITLNVTNIDSFNHIIKMLSFIVLYISAIYLDYLPQSFMEWINSIVDYFLRIISPFFNDCVLKNFNIMQFVFPNFFFKTASTAKFKAFKSGEFGGQWSGLTYAGQFSFKYSSVAFAVWDLAPSWRKTWSPLERLFISRSIQASSLFVYPFIIYLSFLTKT